MKNFGIIDRCFSFDEEEVLTFDSSVECLSTLFAKICGLPKNVTVITEPDLIQKYGVFKLFVITGYGN